MAGIIEELNKSKTKINYKNRFMPLIEYFKVNGTIANIKQAEVFDFNGIPYKIGLLIANLRREKKEGKISEENIIFLEYLGMNWGYSFKDTLAVFKDYYKKNGSLEKLNQYEMYEFKGKSVKIGSLLGELRKDYRNNKLSQQQIDIMEIMGIVWSPKNIDNVLFPLRKYYEKNGTISDIKTNDKIEIDGVYYNIGKQIKTFKSKYNTGKLKQKYIDALNEMNIQWTAKEKVNYEQKI